MLQKKIIQNFKKVVESSSNSLEIAQKMFKILRKIFKLENCQNYQKIDLKCRTIF